MIIPEGEIAKYIESYKREKDDIDSWIKDLEEELIKSIVTPVDIATMKIKWVIKRNKQLSKQIKKLYKKSRKIETIIKSLYK